MKEYIEREAIITELMKGTIISDDLYGMGIMSGIDFATKKIVEAPAADVVEVVRCKDCKYSGMYCFGTSKEETLACLEIEEDGFIRFATATNADGYCSNGKRRTHERLHR